MNKIKIWSIAIAMFVAFFLVSCDNDDDNGTINYDNLGGTWRQVYPEGVVADGYTNFTFRPKTSSEGTLDVYVADWLANRDTTYNERYTLGTNGHVQTFRKMENGSEQLSYDLYITGLDANKMQWTFHPTDGTADHVSNLKRVVE